MGGGLLLQGPLAPHAGEQRGRVAAEGEDDDAAGAGDGAAQLRPDDGVRPGVPGGPARGAQPGEAPEGAARHDDEHGRPRAPEHEMAGGYETGMVGGVDDRMSDSDTKTLALA